MRAEQQPTKQHKKASSRAKDEMWGQLQFSKRSAMSDAELAEIRAIERVGHRRRRQWLNDKLLRDLAGAMSTQDMERQFKPVPFGFPAPPSAFTLASAPEHAAVWEHFRSIDSDKEARVLQAWEAHNRRPQPRHHLAGSLEVSAVAGAPPAVLQHPQAATAADAAAAALARWCRVERRSRAALKKAPVHVVLCLELQALQLVEQGDPSAQLLLEDLADGFARLLVHGLAQYHGLQSTTCLSGGQKAVLLQCRPAPSSSSSNSSSAGAPSSREQEAVAAAQQSPRQEVLSDVEGAGAAAGGTECGGDAAVWGLLHAPDVTCTDIVMALRELGDTLNRHSLGEYIHASVCMRPVAAAGAET